MAVPPPIGTPFLTAGGRVTEPWLAYFASLSGDASVYKSFVPAIFGYGAMSVSSPNVAYYWWRRDGPDVYIQLDVTFTIGGSPSSLLYISTPQSGAPSPSGQVLTAMIQTATGWVAGYAYTENYPTARILVSPLFANWPAGASRVLVSGRYRVA